MRYGGVDTKLLVELIDTGQRLPIHAHPPDAWIKLHLGTAYEKTECWHILVPGDVFVGLKEDVTSDQLLAFINKQDADGILKLLRRIPVKSHQTVYVPAGTLHGFSKGVMVAEVQEPEDLSILLEWKDFDIDGSKGGHMGVGFEKALTAVDKSKRSDSEIASLVTGDGKFGQVLPKEATLYFRLERLAFNAKEQCEPRFAILIALEGRPNMVYQPGKIIAIAKGETVVIPWAAGNLKLRGAGEVLISRPPK